LLPIIIVAAPVRTLTPGHSTSVVESGPPPASAVVAFDDVLKRSSADELNRLLEPQAASSSARPDNAAIEALTRIICFGLSTAIFVSRFSPPFPGNLYKPTVVGATALFNRHRP
jgi:hypothetical protein